MQKYAYKYVVIVSVFTMIAIVSLQYAYMNFARRQADAKFESSVKQALQNTGFKLLEYNSRLRNGISFTLPDRSVRMIDENHFVVNVGDFIEKDVLEHYLREQFTRVNIHLDFEFAIYDCNKGAMVYGNYVSMDGNFENDTHREKFQTFDEFVYYFEVSFPSRLSYLNHEMRVWYFSFGFTLVTLLFFGYALMVIFKQRKFSETQKNFINNITHEFKTPLASIIMSAEVLNKDEIMNDKVRLQRYSQIIQTQAKKLTSEIDRILQLMVSENAETLLKIEELNAYDFAYTSLSDAQLLGDEKNIRLTCDDRSMKIKADAIHLGNIITNLVNNAIKYGDMQRGVDVCLHKSGKTCVLSVRDYGIGIDKKYQKKVFARFFRVPTGDLHNVKGFGLGLSYVKHFVDLHHWTIEIDSELGKGSVFIVQIPLV